MRHAPRPPSILFAISCVVCVSLAGCGGVRQDRTITFSADGAQVGFQHGEEGVFVADKDGGGLVKVFTPGRDVLATSTPLWAPDDRRLLFATARSAEKEPAPRRPSRAEPDPAGDVHPQHPVTYTVWLRDDSGQGAAPAPRELFTAACDHVGYVAAGLAVRWHPDGRRVLYVDRAGESGHALFERDLATGTARRVFPAKEAALALVFDWSPRGKYLTCAAAGTPEGKADGLWVATADYAAWWRVTESAVPDLESLRRASPSWSADGTRFAFVTGGDVESSKLRLATPEGRRTRTVVETVESLHDIRWHPDGKRLGYLQGKEEATLRVVSLEGGPPIAVTDRPVRAFAGWDTSGRHLAYTTADRIPLTAPKEDPHLLFYTDPLARDRVWVAPGDGSGAGRDVFSGMRATFLNWSPKEGKLSLWLTFCPTHRSALSQLFGWGLRRGDPASLLDAATGDVAWMAVDATEKAQIGHYHLLKRDYAGAWRWYEEAERVRSAEKAPDKRPAVERMPDVFSGRGDFTFFEYLCLKKLGRDGEAKARLMKAREPFVTLAKDMADGIPTDGANGLPPEQLRRDLRRFVALAERLYQAEAFLSLDRAEDAKSFFRDPPDGDASEETRFADRVVLAQLLLLEGNPAEAAKLVKEAEQSLTNALSWLFGGRTK